MRVLFGISNDATIAGIAKYYEEKYNEIKSMFSNYLIESTFANTTLTPTTIPIAYFTRPIFRQGYRQRLFY